MNTERFTGRSLNYARYRPSYPAALLDYLYGEAGFPERGDIADIGAGTGIFSRLLLERGSAVACVEPNAEMRGQLETVLAGHPRALILAAPAESTTLPDAGVDAITAAQAFHWFDRQAFRQEARRILRPGGKVVLIWNSTDRGHPFIHAHNAVHDRFCPGYTARQADQVESPGAFDDFFAHTCEMRVFDNSFDTDEESYVGRSLSSSYSPREDDPNAAPFVEALRQVFRRHAAGGILRFPNITRCYVGEV